MEEEGLRRFVQCAKLWIMRGSLATEQDGVPVAREIYQHGLKNCPNSIKLWLSAAQCEESLGTAIACGKARALLEKARQANPKCPELWYIFGKHFSYTLQASSYSC